MSTLIKICGLTNLQEAEYLNSNQVDFAGMVLFYEKSKRNISIEQAKKIIASLSPSIQKVAVVVSPTLEQLASIKDAGFDIIQIHGTLPDGIWATNPLPILKAFNISDLESFSDYEKLDGVIGYVFDSQEPGSGKTFNWNLLNSLPSTKKMVLLAGGLNSTNVHLAIRQVHPMGVDVSSAVEYSDIPGKDPEKIKSFVNAVRSI